MSTAIIWCCFLNMTKLCGSLLMWNFRPKLPLSTKACSSHQSHRFHSTVACNKSHCYPNCHISLCTQQLPVPGKLVTVIPYPTLEVPMFWSVVCNKAWTSRHNGRFVVSTVISLWEWMPGLQGGSLLSFWYRCAARRTANGGLKNGQAQKIGA